MVRDDDTPGAERVPPQPQPHPFAIELAERLAAEPGARVLVLGVGNGRNVPPLVAAGLRVAAVEEDPERARGAAARFAAEPAVRIVRARYAGPYPFAGGCAGALSTSALLHGTLASAGAAVAAVRARLRPGAPFFATFGSRRDPRFGAGTRIDDATYAPTDGGEAGVPHLYCDEPALRALLAGFGSLDLREGSAAETAGAWAHAPGEAAGLRHWFVRAFRA